jgi:hypothetical protein
MLQAIACHRYQSETSWGKDGALKGLAMLKF